MHIEISAGGLRGGVAVASFQSGMKSYISGTDGMISNFKAVSAKTYNLNGGIGRLSEAVGQVNSRVSTEESRKSGAETVQRKANDFLELAMRVDKSVATMVKQDREELYGKYPALKPTLGQWVKDRLSDAWNWLCNKGQSAVDGVKQALTAVKDTVQKAWNSIVAFYEEHKVLIDKIVGTVLIVVGVLAAIAIIVGTGGIAAAGIAAGGATGLGAALVTILGVSEAVAAKIVVGAIATTLVAGTMNIWSTWDGPGSDSKGFQITQTFLNGAVAIMTSFALIGGTLGLGMETMIRDGITKGAAIIGKKVTFKTAEHYAILASHAVGEGAFWSTVGAEGMNFLGTLFSSDNDTFNQIQSVLSKTSIVLTTLYGTGLLYDSIKKYFSRKKTYGKKEIGKKNKTDGTIREYHYEEELKVKYPTRKGYSIIKENYLLDEYGNIVKDPVTGTARKIDLVVVKDGEVVGSYEVTSQTASKTAQISKETRVRNAGGNYIRDESGKLIEIPRDMDTQVIRRD